MSIQIGKLLPDGSVRHIKALHETLSKDLVRKLRVFYPNDRRVDALLSLGDIQKLGPSPYGKWTGTGDTVHRQASLVLVVPHGAVRLHAPDAVHRQLTAHQVEPVLEQLDGRAGVTLAKQAVAGILLLRKIPVVAVHMALDAGHPTRAGVLPRPDRAGIVELGAVLGNPEGILAQAGRLQLGGDEVGGAVQAAFAACGLDDLQKLQDDVRPSLTAQG